MYTNGKNGLFSFLCILSSPLRNFKADGPFELLDSIASQYRTNNSHNMSPSSSSLYSEVPFAAISNSPKSDYVISWQYKSSRIWIRVRRKAKSWS